VGESDRPTGSDLAAFDDVYKREFDYVWRTLGRLGVPVAELADGVHDVFIVLHRRWRELDHDRPLRPWLFGVARNVAATRFRNRIPVASVASEDLAAPEPDRQRDLLWRALALLDEERRVVIILHDIEGHTGAAIAELLGIPANTVHSRLRLARADLVAVVRRLRGDS
jgi:RNA polymerase sigma-70 factor (ECF subfamily)